MYKDVRLCGPDCRFTQWKSYQAITHSEMPSINTMINNYFYTQNTQGGLFSLSHFSHNMPLEEKLNTDKKFNV